MKKIAILITIFTLLYCDIQFKPIIALSYLSTGSDFQPVNKDIKIFGAGLGVVWRRWDVVGDRCLRRHVQLVYLVN